MTYDSTDVYAYIIADLYDSFCCVISTTLITIQTTLRTNYARSLVNGCSTMHVICARVTVVTWHKRMPILCRFAYARVRARARAGACIHA